MFINLIRIFILINGQLFSSTLERIQETLVLLLLMSYYQHFTGSIPKDIGYLTSLEDLALSSNNLTGMLNNNNGKLQKKKKKKNLQIYGS